MNLLGVDIGGTKILIVLTDNSGFVKKRLEMPTTSASVKIVLDNIFNNFRNFGTFEAVGIGIAGDIDSKNGVLRFSPNLPKWKNVQLRKYFEKKLNVPVSVENDANCAAYGSFAVDGKKKHKNFITVTLGTGVGSGIIINGELYRGSTGSAGEVGHITINPDGPKCNCGNYGCLEAYIGTEGIIRFANNMGIEGRDITVKAIAQMAKDGNTCALKIYEKFAWYLAIGVSGLINIFNPDMLTFSGGVSNNWELIEKRFFNELKKRTFRSAFDHVKITKSKDIKNLGAIGAALLSVERLRTANHG